MEPLAFAMSGNSPSTTAAPERARSPFARLAELLAGHDPGKPLISLSLGEPQHAVPDFVGPVLAKYTAEFGRYPIAKGIEPFRKAAASWLSRRFKLPRPLDGLVSRLLRRSTDMRARGDVERLTRALEAEVGS